MTTRSVRRGSAVALALWLLLPPTEVVGAERLSIRVARPQPGAPLTLGVPFPRGVVSSPEKIRVVTSDGREIPAQVTEIATWEPADPSVKWAWVFFFAEGADRYVLEFGDDVVRSRPAHALEIVNSQRAQGLAEITTGPMRLVIQQGEGGFVHSVLLDLDGNGFDEADLIAAGPGARGSFADLLDDAGLDPSRATIRRTVIDKGSGPLHAIVRVEGEYRYTRDDNVAGPFVLRVHAYANRPYVRVLHTFVYTGTPDKHAPQTGEYPHVATQAGSLIRPDPTDAGWSQPNDRLAALGLGLQLRLGPEPEVRTALVDGTWWSPGPARPVRRPLGAAGRFSVAQTGPKPDRVPPVPTATPTSRLDGFTADVRDGDAVVDRAERAAGWVDVFDGTRGVAMGVRHFLEEYPKELAFDAATGELTAYFWSPRAGPMSFARATDRPASEGAIENWAQGIAKTSELALFFHGADTSADDVARTMRHVLDPPVAHVDPSWYGRSGVYGAFAPAGEAFPEFQRALDYKFEWMLFNQKWQPWYGLFDHGDMMNTFDGSAWNTFGHNEPAQDFMLWLQFMRTGDPRLFDAALAMSRHTMDVDNTHWPTGPEYHGESNYPLDYWNTLNAPPGTKYLGVGRRHSAQHWLHILSAHVWVQGWLASYYLAGEHRGLDVARLTADMHLRRLWGEHELTGRRLYLSVWNLVEVWDATKDPRYEAEVKARVERMLRLQRTQRDNLVIDRYGYANVYASHGLARYLDMTDDPAVRAALIRHARAVRDVPPLDHWMESYLSTIHGLVLGYRLSGEPSFLDEMRRRLEPLRVDELPRPVDDTWTQAALFEALEAASHLPDDPNRHRLDLLNRGPVKLRAGQVPPPRRAGWAFTNGLRIFGWTHAFTLPYALAQLEDTSPPPAPAAARDGLAR